MDFSSSSFLTPKQQNALLKSGLDPNKYSSIVSDDFPHLVTEALNGNVTKELREKIVTNLHSDLLLKHPQSINDLLYFASENNWLDILTPLLFLKLKSLDSNAVHPDVHPIHDVLSIIYRLNKVRNTDQISFYYPLLINLLKYGLKDLEDTPGKDYFTPLVMACRSENLTTISILLGAGYSPNSKISKNETILDNLNKLLLTHQSAGAYVQNLSAIKDLLIAFGAYETHSTVENTITAINFANLVGDAFITRKKYNIKENSVGFDLEGSHHESTLEFTNTLLQSFQAEGHPDLSLQFQFKEIEKEIQEAKILATVIAQSKSNTYTHFSLSPLIEMKLHRLQGGQKLLLPFGWKAVKGGHFMLCEIEKNPNGYFSMNVINTGSGIEWHMFCPTGKKRLLQPFERYEGIDWKEFTKTNFFDALLALRDQPNSGEDYTAKDIYKGILKRFDNHRVENPNPDLSLFITAQRSGTCSIRSIMAFLRLKLGKNPYKILKNYMQTKASLVFLETHKEKLEADPELRDTLRRTSENLARQVNKLNQEGINLDPAMQEAPLMIDKALAALNNLNPPVPPFSIPDTKAEALLGMKALTEIIEEYQQEMTSSIEHPSMPPVVSRGSTQPPRLSKSISPFEHLNLLKEFCVTDRSSEIITETAVQILIDDVLTLPMPKLKERGAADIWSKPPLTFTPHPISILLNFLLMAKTNPEILMNNRLVAINKLYAIAWKVACEMEDSNLPAKLQLKNYYVDTTHLHLLQQNIHDLSYNPEVEQQLKEVIQFFETNISDKTYENTLFKFSIWKQVEVNHKRETFDYRSSCFTCLALPPPENSGDFYFAQAASVYQEAHKNSQYVMQRKRALESAAFKNEITYEDYDISRAWTSNKGKANPYFPMMRDMALCCESFHHETKFIRSERLKLFENDFVNSLIIPIHKLEDIQFSKKTVLLCDIMNMRNLDKVLQPRLFQLNCYTQVEAHLQKKETFPYLSNFSIKSENQTLVKLSDTNKTRHHPLFWHDNLTISRFIQHYQFHIEDWLNPQDQVITNLILFSEGRLTKALSQNPQLAHYLLQLLDKGITEFNLSLRNKSEKQSTPEIPAVINLFFVKGQSLDYMEFHHLLTPEIIQRERVKLLADLNYSISIKSHSNFKKEPDLVHLCMLKLTLLSKLSLTKEVLTTLANLQAKIYIDGFNEKTHPSYKNVAAAAYQKIQEKYRCYLEKSKPHLLCQSILEAYGVNCPLTTKWEGEYPLYNAEIERKSYSVNLLNGQLKSEGMEYGKPLKLYSTIEFKKIFGANNYPLANVTKISSTHSLITLYEIEDALGRFRFTLDEDKYKQNETTTTTQKYLDGSWHTLLKRSVRTLPTPLPPLEHGTNYRVWANGSHFVVEDSKGKTYCRLLENKQLLLKEDPREWQILDLRSLPKYSPLTKLTQFEHPEFTGAYQSKTSEGGDHTKIEFPRYRDKNLKPLEFEERSVEIKTRGSAKKSSKKLVWTSNPQYFISANQSVPALGNVKSYLVLEDVKGTKKILIPEKTVTEINEKHPKRYQEALYIDCHLITLDKKEHLCPIGLSQNIVLAYHFLGSKDYKTAMECLSKTRGTRAFNDEELSVWHFCLSKIEKQMIIHLSQKQ